MFKRFSQMTAGDSFWYPTSSFESVSAKFIGEFPEGYAFRIDGEVSAQHMGSDQLFEMVG